MTRKIIGIVGLISTGKDTVANYIATKYNFTHISTGDLIRKYILDNNLGETSDRTFLQKIGNDLRLKHGEDYLVKMALDHNKGDILVSGLRAVSEVEKIQKSGGVILRINSSLEQRYSRSIVRGRIDGNITLEEFKKQQALEIDNTTLQSMNLNKVLEMSDYIINNDLTEKELFKLVDQFIKQYLQNV